MRMASIVSLSIVFAIVAAPAASAAFGMPDALTPRGQTVERLYNMIAAMGVAMFLIVFVWLVILIVRFREGTGHGKATHEAERHSLKAELAWTLVPLALVLFIGYAAYGGLVTLDHGIAPKDAKMEIKVVGSQWNWMFDYGDNVALFSNPDPNNGTVLAENAFLVPQDTPILLNITSTDVIHAFQVLDANRAYVIFNDANPLGANKFALQTASFPPGEYLIQCNKMCLNPGHAYMHATMKAVPLAQYDRWFAEKKAKGDASLVAQLVVSASGGKLVGADGKAIGPQDIATHTRVILTFDTPSQDIILTVNGGQAKTIRAGETVDTFYAFTADHAGKFNLTSSSGGSIQFTAVDAIAKTVSLGDFKLVPPTLTLEVGKTYLIAAVNVGAATHDLNIGHFNGGTAPEIQSHSASVAGGGSASFLYTPTAKGTFDMWCNQSGHHALGMFGTVTVQ